LTDTTKSPLCWGVKAHSNEYLLEKFPWNHLTKSLQDIS
jgi:hypothetical protein